MLPFGRLGDWNLIFQDEFDADVLDTDIWTDRYWYNGGQQINHGGVGMFAPDDVYLENGLLRLRAQKRDVIADDGTPYNYSTGYASTSGIAGISPLSFEFLYGYAEVRARVPVGQGFLSSFWAVNSSMIFPTYDPTRWEGEIDVFEIFGHETNKYPMAYHWKNDTPDYVDYFETWEGPEVPDFSKDFHVFGFEWKPGEVIRYVDGVERWRHNENIQSTPMFLILSLWVGHGSPYLPDETTPFPSYFDIDYVRVWQRSSGGYMNVHEINIGNWTNMGTNVPVPKWSVDIEIKWTDKDGVDHEHSSTRYFPNELANIPAKRMKKYMERLIIAEARIKLGIDEDRS